jgi:hypothetical protein
MAKTKRTNRQVKELAEMKTSELRERHREVFGEKTASRNKQYLVKKLAKAIEQKVAVAKPARSKPARKAKGKTTKPRDPRLPEPGTVLEKTYKGETYKIKVLEDGFEYDGTHYRSLSGVAREITGQIWNGYLWAGLVQRPKQASA